MIEMSYKGEKYDYGDQGKQGFDIETKMVMKEEDVSIADIIEAAAKLMNIATYRVTVDKIREACNELEEMYGNDRII